MASVKHAPRSKDPSPSLDQEPGEMQATRCPRADTQTSSFSHNIEKEVSRVENLSSNSGPSFRFYDLPGEIQVMILQQVSTCRDFISMLQVSRGMNKLVTTYTRPALLDRIVAPFYDFYRFLTTLHFREDSLLVPPLGGWPNLTYDDCRAWGKSDLVIDVLRNMPYLEQSRRRPRDWYGNPNPTYLIDYSKFRAGDAYPGGKDNEHGGDDDPYAYDDWPWGMPYRNLITLKTNRSLDVIPLGWNPVHDSTISYRGQPAYGWTLERFFADWRARLIDCKAMFVPTRAAPFDCQLFQFNPNDRLPYDPVKLDKEGEPSLPGVRFRGPHPPRLHRPCPDLEWVRRLYLTHGWPEPNWNKEACFKALAEFVSRRRAEE